MNLHTFQVSLLLALALSGPTQAHETDSQSGPLGKVSFPNSCDSKVQPLSSAPSRCCIRSGTAGEKTFRDVLKDDPDLRHRHLGHRRDADEQPAGRQGASPKAAEQAQAAIDQGRRIGAKTQRERDYIEAVAAYYEDSRRAREGPAGRAGQGLRGAGGRYPDDDEAQIFGALYIAGTQSQADQSYAAYLKAAAILERQFGKYPDHPGIAHYLIHSYDAPPIAEQGLPAARRYAGIAPDAPHALHMPSHIFTRVGAWQDSVATNAARPMSPRRAASGRGLSRHRLHGVRRLAARPRRRGAPVIDDALQVRASHPALRRAYADRRDAGALRGRARRLGAAAKLAAAAAAPIPSSTRSHITPGVGAARSGDVAAAEQEAQQLETQHKALVEAKNNYWATEVEIQRLAAAAWIALREGQADEALRLMRAAADLEDRNEKHIVTPGRVVPARELLGEMLLEAQAAGGRAEGVRGVAAARAEPVAQFRRRSAAAEAAGDRAQGRRHYEKLVAMAKNADSVRPELASAKGNLAQR